MVPTFIGREDILEAMQQTHFNDRSSGSDMPAISVLTGLGGSGKTQIALKFALDFEERCVLVYAHAITDPNPTQIPRRPSLFHQCRIGGQSEDRLRVNNSIAGRITPI